MNNYSNKIVRVHHKVLTYKKKIKLSKQELEIENEAVFKKIWLAIEVSVNKPAGNGGWINSGININI